MNELLAGFPWSERILAGLHGATVGPRCAVTGAAGFVGRHLVAALLDLGCEVVTLDCLPGCDVQADVRDVGALTAAFADVDCVFHTAAVVSILGIAPAAERDRIFSINVDGTKAVVAACRAAGVARLVHTSTANVAFDEDPLEVGEDHGYAESFVDIYGESKRQAEQAVLEADLATVALRPGGIWGPGPGGYMLQTFLTEFAAGRVVAYMGDGEAVVDNTHVHSLVRAMLLGAERLNTHPDTVSGRPFFITDDERIPGMEWFRPVVEGLGGRFPTWGVPAPLMYFIGWLGEWAHRLGAPAPSVTRLGVLKMTRPSAFKIDAARAALGYEPLTGSVDGLRVHLEDYRAILEARKS
jgi:3beta-hydroxy-delta5-steroid dehydrogenase/steroid delta-isomerase